MDLFDKSLVDAIKRADVYQYHNWKTDTMHLVSQNLEEPLTDEEKERIRDYFAMRCVPVKIVFDN